jgi:hypothetical protein
MSANRDGTARRSFIWHNDYLGGLALQVQQTSDRTLELAEAGSYRLMDFLLRDYSVCSEWTVG